jgi:glycosyltransferase involved in cell wall biosynthesis
MMQHPERPTLLLPINEPSGARPEVSIVVPALNEEITIGEFVEWCQEGLRLAGISGEILIVDSSTDQTPQIALAKGARVLKTPKRGLGQAYKDAIPFIRGEFVILGDCDLTYDFRELLPFVDSYKAGSEFVMGSRFKGEIESGAMPALHRYFGTPLTTWILNSIYGSKFSDIHCGMRGISLSALKRMELTSSSWEYASEMVLKATRMGLKIDEVPVSFYKDRDGRLSHHKRSGFLSPWIAGWINLKVMLVFSPDTFLLKPSSILFFLGLILAGFSLPGTISLGQWGLGLNSAVIGVVLTIFALSLLQIGIISRLVHGLRSGFELRLQRGLTYDRGLGLTLGLFVLGGISLTIFGSSYVLNDFSVPGNSSLAIIGVTLLAWSGQVFAFSLLLELLRRKGVLG